MALLPRGPNFTSSGIVESSPVPEVFLILSGVVGMFFLSLSILTFSVCRDPTWTKAPLINVSINLWLIDLLYIVYNIHKERINSNEEVRVILVVVEDILRLIFFMWTFLDSMVLYFLVKDQLKIGLDITKVPDWKWLLFYGYTVPFALSISALVPSVCLFDLMCWDAFSSIFVINYISTSILFITMSVILFIRIFVHLIISLKRSQNENLQTSSMIHKKLLISVVLKGLVQFIFTVCTMMATFFPDKKNLNVWRTVIQFFVFQQGTFIFFIHCFFDPKVREKYKNILGAWCHPKTENISEDAGCPADSSDIHGVIK